eukprot:scaffold19186_cov117-Isochrysis_galbana.AAC.2
MLPTRCRRDVTQLTSQHISHSTPPPHSARAWRGAGEHNDIKKTQPYNRTGRRHPRVHHTPLTTNRPAERGRAASRFISVLPVVMGPEIRGRRAGRAKQDLGFVMADAQTSRAAGCYSGSPDAFTIFYSVILPGPSRLPCSPGVPTHPSPRVDPLPVWPGSPAPHSPKPRSPFHRPPCAPQTAGPTSAAGLFREMAARASAGQSDLRTAMNTSVEVTEYPATSPSQTPRSGTPAQQRSRSESTYPAAGEMKKAPDRKAKTTDSGRPCPLSVATEP